MALFYLLRPGEYCMPAKNPRARTVQFRRQDVRLWKNNELLAHEAPLAILLTADAATLRIENQKNAQRGSTIHHTARSPETTFCAVKSLARIVHRLMLLGADHLTPISLYGTGQHVVTKDITAAIRQAGARTGLFQRGYTVDRVSAHSLRAGGAMAMKLAGKDENLIKKVGRWSSSTWLTYIHSQISNLTAGLAEEMAVTHLFYNVG
jgi:hypothetical protein